MDLIAISLCVLAVTVCMLSPSDSQPISCRRVLLSLLSLMAAIIFLIILLIYKLKH